MFSNGQQDVENIPRISVTSLKKCGFQIKQNCSKSLYYIRKSFSQFQSDL